MQLKFFSQILRKSSMRIFSKNRDLSLKHSFLYSFFFFLISLFHKIVRDSRISHYRMENNTLQNLSIETLYKTSMHFSEYEREMSSYENTISSKDPYLRETFQYFVISRRKIPKGRRIFFY